MWARGCSRREAIRGTTVGVTTSLRLVLSTASGMALQCLGWRRDGGDGHTGPMVMEGMRLTGPTSQCGPVRAWNRRPSPFESSAVLFQGCGAPSVREWAAQCRGADTGLTAQCRTVAGMASPGGLAEQRRDMTPRRVRGMVRTCRCRSIKWPGQGEQVRGGMPVGASSEAEPHPRGRLALQRGGPRPRGRPALERGGTSPEGVTGPRARWGFVSAVLRPSSEAEFRSRVPGPTVLVGRWGHQGRDYVVRGLGLRICLCFVFDARKWVPLVFREPLWLSLTVAPEHLQGYPLGSRRC
jgi:hypothetical protein